MVCKIMRRLLLARDVFGEPIHVAYKGHETFRTTPGSILTLLLQVFTMVYMVTKIIEVVEQTDPQIVKYSKPLSKDDKRALIPL